MTEQRRTVARVGLAAVVKRLRIEADLTQKELADMIGLSNQQIANIEMGRTGVKPEYIERILDGLKIEDTDEINRTDLLERARASRQRTGKVRRRATSQTFVAPVVRRFNDFEEEATERWDYSLNLIPSMLQTPDYAKAVNRWFARLEPRLSDRHVKLRLARQKLLRREDPGPLSLWEIIGEAALNTMVGSPAIMLEQLEHIRHTVAELSHVAFQILTFEAGNGPLGNGNVMVVRHPMAPTDMVYLEGADDAGRIEDREEEIERILWSFEQTRALAEPEHRSLTLLNRRIKSLKEMLR
ncbi:transcriptional regulator with XRE-family HTH domain [Kibdelosporangium banguiense]|uniref:Transcriptional regulator with XRE-family HTH domain n=1 Tax=Kibdelosporangium banguiense TaxID=1365924 RepID=A0ABS4TGL5_9PSEU|nr:helix-turn-helix transcriptional regulator [Kibdelosporangium banguiense]MBP2323565.1 transcriptional regulator with XRE-family HTH domain [Kibdelosporangium banguiense]